MKNHDNKGPEPSERTAARERVVRFFLDLYKLELEVTELDKASCEFKPLPRSAGGADYAYELRVESHWGLKARRVSIGSLG